MLGGTAWTRGEREDGHGRPARGKRCKRASEHDEIVRFDSVRWLYDVTWVEVRVLGRYTTTALVGVDGHGGGRGVAVEGDPLEVACAIRTGLWTVCKEMGVLPFFVLVPPDTALAVTVDIADAHTATGLGLSHHDAFYVGVHAPTVGELHECELVGQGWKSQSCVLCFFALHDGSGLGLHLRGRRGGGGFGPRARSEGGEGAEAVQATGFAGGGGEWDGNGFGVLGETGAERKRDVGRDGRVWEL